MGLAEDQIVIRIIWAEEFTGAAAEPKNLDGGKTVLNFSVATSRFRGEGENREQFTEWHRIAAWGKLASTIGNVAKGAHVKVEGDSAAASTTAAMARSRPTNRRLQDRGPRKGSTGGRSLRGPGSRPPPFFALLSLERLHGTFPVLSQ